MAPCSGPVPSKNALRALRSLAFGTPGLVVGAVGGVCALAGIQYEIQGKIRLAQDMVDTKRTLAALTSGRGKDRPPVTTPITTLIPPEAPPAYKLKAVQVQPQQRAPKPHVPRGNRTTLPRSSDDRVHRSATSAKSWRRAYASDQENSQAERIRRATIKTMKPNSYSVYGRDSQSLDLAPRSKTDIDTVSGRAEGLPVPTDRARPQADLLQPNATVSDIFTSSFIAISHEQSSNDLLATPNALSPNLAPRPQASRPGSVSSREDNMDPALYTSWLEAHSLKVDGFRGWLKTLRSLRVLESNTASVEQSILEIARMRGDGLIAKQILSTIDKRVQDTQKDQAGLLPPQGRVDGQELSSVSRLPAFHLFDLPPPSTGLETFSRLSHALSDVDYDRYIQLSTNIASRQSRLERDMALASNMEELISAGTAADLNLAELLFHTFFKSLQASSTSRRIPTPAIRLAASLLGDGHSERAAELLFPYGSEDLVSLKDASRETKARMLYGSAHDFLAWYGSREAQDVDKLDQATRQTLKAATARGINLANLPVGYLLAPVMRSLCARGHEERAHKLLKDIEHEYGIAFSDTLDARAKLIIGYANFNRLVPLKKMLDECHAKGVSRHHPAWYSRLFQQVFQRHLRCNPLTESYEFLVHAMAYWGLMPTQSVSSVLLSECLRHERYDLIREYVQAVRELYSFIDLGTGTSLLAWRFGRVWKEMQASCEQIFKGCQALAYCATDDPFGSFLRDVVEEASRLNISTRLSALLQASGQCTNVQKVLQLSFPEIIEWARALVSGPHTQSTMSEAREELLVQLGALNKLNRLLGGHHTAEQPEHHPHRNASLMKRPSARGERDDGGYGLRIFQTPNILPDRDSLWKYLAMHYAHRQRKGLPANHDLLRHVCQELSRLQRSSEAAELLAAVHESPYASDAKGTPFNEDVLQAWLDVATALDSPLVATKVLWALLDAGPDVILSTPLLLQAEHACRRILDQVIAKRQGRNPSSFQADAAYLQPALRRRYQRQWGIKSNEERLMWKRYKSWDETTVDVPVDGEYECHKIQARRLIWALSTQFRFIFANAPHQGAPGFGMLPVFASCAPFYRWVTRRWTLGAGDVEQAPADEVALVDDVLDELVARECGGDWGRVVGVMGFSQGARIAARCLVIDFGVSRSDRIQHQRRSGGPKFKMADLPYRGKSGEDFSRKDDNDDEDEELDETQYKSVKDAVLFAIEVSPSMLKKPATATSKKADTSSPLLAALRCAFQFMQQRIISSPKDLIGVLLYGTEETKFYDADEDARGGWSFPNCYLLTDLDVPDADDVRRLKDLVEDESAESEAEVFKPSDTPVQMHTVLFCANQIFQQRAANFASRRLFIVTDNDNPPGDNKVLRNQATVRAKDLYDLGVIIELFPISSPEHEFDQDLFYNDIVYKATPSDPDAVIYNPSSVVDVDQKLKAGGSADGITLLSSLLTSVASKITPKRALFSSTPLEIAPGLRISVKGYLLYKHQQPARSSYIWLEGETPKIVKGERQQLVEAADDTREVTKAEIRRAYVFGGAQILFTDAEMKELRNWGEPIIKVVGFKPIKCLPLWANIKNSTFLYPSEEDYVGSTRVYSALYQKLSKSSIFGVCWFVPRRNAVPVMAALVPTLPALEVEDRPNPAGTSSTGAPQGLHVIPLPFADDIRQNPPSGQAEPVRAPDSLVDAMRPIVQQLTLPKGVYNPSRYPNPSLQWHYRILQALALDEELPAQPEDKTLPKYKQIDRRVSSEAITWGKELESSYKAFIAENPDAASVGSKRVAPTTNRGKAATAAAGGQAVAQLKEFCTAKKLSVSGNKAALVERIEQWFEDNS
ncbi:hypothetical protein DV738_g1128, partial [Chaetothyriales sp. CBS 135597]